jgi:hypothetical protein
MKRKKQPPNQRRHPTALIAPLVRRNVSRKKMKETETDYDEQEEQLLGSRRKYPVRIRPIKAGVWPLQARSHEYRPYLFYWAMATLPDSRTPEGKSTWTMWFGFREPPMDHLKREYQEGVAAFLAEAEAPHNLMARGFTFDLFVGPDGVIANGEVIGEADDNG